MVVRSIASGSSGNCYVVSDKETTVLIEAGIAVSRIQAAMDYRLTEVDGCLVSHEHGDHIKAAKQLAAKSINVYATRGTFEAAGLSGHRYKAVKSLEAFKIKTMTITPFDVQHDAVEPVGFIIETSVNGDRLLYATDTHYFKYKIPAVDIVMIECNYDEERIRQNVLSGEIALPHSKRVYSSHMSLQTVLLMLDRIDTSKLREVWLLHLSDQNSNEEKMVKELRQKTGVKINVA